MLNHKNGIPEFTVFKPVTVNHVCFLLISAVLIAKLLAWIKVPGKLPKL
jgi:hypothetical protein